MSTPPPSSPPPEERPAGAPRTRAREITLRLDAPEAKGWRRRLGAARTGGDGSIRLAGTEIHFEHEATLQHRLTIPAGLVAVAAVDRGRRAAGEDEGRFAILHRMGPNAVIPAEEGVEGWLWTARSGSALPMLGDDGAPNLALVFVKPLEPEVVESHFDPGFVSALADRSPLGAPVVFGLLARVADESLAESAFHELGVIRPLTDREVAPAQRRHLPTDRPANPAVNYSDATRRRTSIPPPRPR
jgi:hypothetical protein